MLHRNVGPRQKPGEKNADNRRDNLPRDREREAIVDGIDDAHAGDRLPPAVEAVDDRAAGLADLKAVQQQQKQRRDDQKRDERQQ